MNIPIYPDLRNNPDNDPRVAQEQYEAWARDREAREEKSDDR